MLRRVDPNGVLLSENVRRHVEGENIPHRMFERR